MSRSRIGKPKGSRRAYPSARRSGSRLTAIRPPSRGRIGSRFSTMSTMLTVIPASAISIIGRENMLCGSICATFISKAQPSAMTRFAAGPAANLVMALGWALLMKVAQMLPQSMFSLPMMLMAEAGITVNIVLMVLNLLPILPLDGGRIAVSLLPNRLAIGYARLEPFGFPILLMLIFIPPHVLGVVMMPMVQASIDLIEAIFQL